MRSNHHHQSELLLKLDGFIRKYYVNLLIRGGLTGLGLIVSFFLVLSVLEYFGQFGTGVRTFLFYSYIAATTALIWMWVIKPLMGLYRIGPVLDYDEAAKIVGRHFSQVSDKLLNTLQLEKMAAQQGSNDLLLASIDQRVRTLRPVPFPEAIDLSLNKRFLQYALPPLFVLLGIIMVRPALVTESTRRLMAHRTEFLPVAPFTFQIANSSLSADEGSDFELLANVTGNEVPNELFVEIDGQRSRMATSEGSFAHTFRKVSSETTFRLYGGGFYSESFTLKVLPKAALTGMKITLEYPAYLKQQRQTVANTGDLVVPEGTRVTWEFDTRQADLVAVYIDSAMPAQASGSGKFKFASRFRKDAEYKVVVSNRLSPRADTVAHRIQVIQDQYPSVVVDEARDSTNDKRLFFNGLAKDDHGFSSLQFIYKSGQNGNFENAVQREISLNSGHSSAQFFHSFDISTLGLAPGTELEYYFQIWDNDGVNGPKSARSPARTYRVATTEELSQQVAQRSNQMQRDMANAIKEVKDIKKELSELQQQLIDKKSLDWQDKKKFETLMERQKQLQQNVENVKQQNETRTDKLNELMPIEERLAEKQAQLQELFNEVLSDEMKQLFEKMEKMLDDMNKDKLQEALENMKFNTEDLEKELDRSLELFKQLEFEQKMEEMKNRLENLAKKQDELSKESGQKDAKLDDIAQKQDELNEEFKKIEQGIEDLDKRSDELKSPAKMDDVQKQGESVKQDQQQSKDQLGKNEGKKASQSQKNAADKMKEMAQQMGNMMAQMEQQGEEEDMNSLRQIIENLLSLSFNQETLIKDLKATNRSDPRYVDLARKQRKLKDDSKLVEDSLFALSKRVEQIKTAINREIRSVNQNMIKALEEMGNRNTPVVLSRQQLALTSVNNLALLLSEALNQMQQAMAQSSGSGSCSKPGSKPGQGKKPSAANMRQLQEQLNKQMESMQKSMEQGQKPGKKPGQSPSGMSQELAKMAAQQEALRGMMRDYESKMKQDAKGGTKSGTNLDDMIRKMEQTETDLVNKNITTETLRRQQEILTKLLEVEKSERERELDNKRESREAKDHEDGNPAEFFKYKSKKNSEAELLQTVPAELNPFYRNKVEEYFRKNQQ